MNGTLTIGDAAKDLGIPLPGLVWHEGRADAANVRNLEEFITDHSGHSLVATAHAPVRCVTTGESYRAMTLHCPACAALLDKAVAESGWGGKLDTEWRESVADTKDDPGCKPASGEGTVEP